MKRAIAMLTLLVVACSSDPTDAIVRRIIEDLAAQRFGSATARYRAEEERILSPAAAVAWRRGLEHEDPTVREWSVDALSRIGAPEDVPRVSAVLDDPFRRVQEAAARGLSAMDPEAAFAAFIGLLRDGNRLQQTIGAQGLADLGDTRAATPLIEVLEDSDVDAGVRGVIAQSLAALADPTAIEPLAAVVADGAATLQLRRTAVDALATFEEPRAVEAMRRLLESDDDYIREVAGRVVAARG